MIDWDAFSSTKKLDRFNNKKLFYLTQPNLKGFSLVGQSKIGQIFEKIHRILLISLSMNHKTRLQQLKKSGQSVPGM